MIRSLAAHPPGRAPAKAWRRASALCLLLGLPALASGQTAYFADGYHGGVYGHYPSTFTQFMVEAMNQHPEWRLNLEIEPETWDSASTNTPEAYQAFRALAADQSTAGRIEFVNPAYGQSYLWNLSGESVIQQFEHGMRKLREHFPNAVFSTYCSEEPCFTSALPGILRSFGFTHAVLKNPNTCWGGYVRAFGGELVNWIGPDGTVIPTVPRYGIESLKPGSTWETIAAANGPGYVQAALAAGIQHPIGMCLQDAGWRWGPWLAKVGGAYAPTEYTTWRHYFEQVAVSAPTQDWRVNQEDVRVSLVWGAQVLQGIAQQVRRAETRIVQAEKLAAIAGVRARAPWPGAALDEAWRTLLLAQHHDCWIVPYNGRPNHTWADKVADWTGATLRASQESIDQSTSALVPPSPTASASDARRFVRVFNTLGIDRRALASIRLPPEGMDSPSVRDASGHEWPAQVVDAGGGNRDLIFPAAVPALGYATYALGNQATKHRPGASAGAEKDGLFRLETDLYRLSLDPRHGGTITSLEARRDGHRELVDRSSPRRFNELRGYFSREHRFHSTAEASAKLELLENGPVRVRVRITGQISSNAVTQIITLVQGEARIDFSAHIDWQGNPGIGAEEPPAGDPRRQRDQKAFYDDRFKLLALFPLSFPQPHVFKNAPFDATESQLDNTFFDTWSGIKNNVIVDWVDVLDRTKHAGMALLSDHTTSYTHGAGQTLGLTLLYSGPGLWDREYRIHHATEVNYALVPHHGDWAQAGLWTAADAWHEPLITTLFLAASPEPDCSLLSIDGGGWEVPTLRQIGGALLVRLFNPTDGDRPRTLRFDGPASRVELVQLNGTVIRQLATRKDRSGRSVFELALPRLGLGTLRITP